MSNPPPHMLILDPKSILTFTPPFNNKSQCAINVTNPTPYGIYFKMKTTACHRYCVKPKMGRLLPYSKEVITVRLKAPKGEGQDKFKLLTFIAPNNTDSVETAWEKFNESDAMSSKFFALFLTNETESLKPEKSTPEKLPSTISIPPEPKTVKMIEYVENNEKPVEIVSCQMSGGMPGLKFMTMVFILIIMTAFWVGDTFNK